MYFDYSDSFWIEEDSLYEMARLVVEDGMTLQEALNEVSSGWEDDAFWEVGKVEGQVMSYVQKLIGEEF